MARFDAGATVLARARIHAPDMTRSFGPADDQHCLTTALYYEAAREPEAGQEAIARVILNRTRQSAYPASVCGVVWQGHERSTGCQFSFTCDGSLRRGPIPVFWNKAAAVAQRMLATYGRNGLADVNPMLNYHAVYVSPAWSNRLVERARIGKHIFYARRHTVLPIRSASLRSDLPTPPEPSVWGIRLSQASASPVPQP